MFVSFSLRGGRWFILLEVIQEVVHSLKGSAGVQNELGVTPENKPKVINSPTFWLVLFGFILLSYALPAFFLVISPRDESGSINFGFAYPGLIAGTLLQLIAIVWGIRSRRTNRPLAMSSVTPALR